jgi:hypothetical protein
MDNKYNDPRSEIIGAGITKGEEMSKEMKYPMR